MFTGYIEYGGRELGNRVRSYELVRSGDLDAPWIQLPSDEPSASVLGHGQYTAADMTAQPWYDPDVEASTRFFGFYPLTVTGISDSTWSADVVEALGDGGTISRGRYGSRQVRVTGFMTAQREDALDLGMSWLQSILEPGRCDLHEGACGTTDMMYYGAAPRPRFDWETAADYAEYVADLERHLHDTKLISGPLIRQQYRRGDTYGYEVEFTIGVEDPHVYTRIITPDLTTSRASTVLASPYNLVKYPSAELGAGSVIVARNIITNPSFETNTSGWTVNHSNVSGTLPSAMRSLTRMTDLKAVGSYAGVGRILGDGATEASGTASLLVYTGMLAVEPGQSISFTAWAAAIVSTVGAARNLRARIEWRETNTGSALGTISLPASTVNGYTWNESGIIVPAGMNYARVLIDVQFDWVSSATAANNSDNRLYVDAVALTIP